MPTTYANVPSDRCPVHAPPFDEAKSTLDKLRLQPTMYNEGVLRTQCNVPSDKFLVKTECTFRHTLPIGSHTDKIDMSVRCDHGREGGTLTHDHGQCRMLFE